MLPAVALVYSMLGTLTLELGPKGREAKQSDRSSELLCARACPLLRELCVAGGCGACGLPI